MKKMDQAISKEQQSYFLSGGSSGFTPWIVVSLIFHLAVFALAWYLVNQTTESRLLYQKATKLQAVAWSPEKRPKHWMPRLAPTPPPPKPVENAIAAKPVEKKPEEKVKEAKKPEKKPEKTAKQLREERKRRMAKALRKVKNKYKSWDGSPDGVKGILTENQKAVLGNEYAAKLRDTFRRNFSVPEVIPVKDYEKLKCKILVKIDRSGKIIHYKLVADSRNTHFDSAALKAVKLTRKVPLPDELLLDLVVNEGVVINFSYM